MLLCPRRKMRRKQVETQQSSSAAKLIWQMFRQECYHASVVERAEKHRRRRPAWRREARPEAVLDARRPVRKAGAAMLFPNGPG